MTGGSKHECSKYEPDALEEEENIGEIAGKVMRIVDRAGVTDLLDIGIDIQQSTNAGESPLYTQDIFGCSDVVDTGAPHDVSKGARSISPGGGVQEMMTNPSTSACFSVARSIGSNTWDVSDFTTLLDGSDSKGLKITVDISQLKISYSF